MTEHCKDVLFKDTAPSVINEEMLLQAIDAQRPAGEAGRLSREEGVVLEHVDLLRLEYKNILRIDYLWVLTGLTRLSLCNNMIEKIENLDALIHLKELDLSFNEIEVIENLDELVHLEVLSLYNNKISVIENMKNLKQLYVFTIGKNFIEDRDTIFHLRKFKKLRSVNMADNPCTKSENFRVFIATFLPQIMYYEYKRISAEERAIGNITFRVRLEEVIEGEAKERAEEQREEDERIEAEMHAESFIEFLGGRQLFDSLFEKDPEGNLLLMIEEVQDLYTEYESLFLDITRKLFETGQERYQTRKIECSQYWSCVETAKEENQLKCQKVMEHFLEKKSAIVKNIKIQRQSYSSQSAVEINYASDAEFMHKHLDIFNELVHDTWKEMMGHEMNLFDQLEETNLNFERALTDLVNSFIEEAQGFFTFLRGYEVQYMETVNEAVNKLIISVYDVNESLVPAELRPLCEDKEVQNNVVATSHDVHLQLIDGREDRLVNKAKTWLSNLVSSIYKNEIARNRGKILEINHFLDCQREEMEELYSETPGLNADITAALS